MVQPAGKDAPQIDPKPILDGWKLLEATAVYRAAGVELYGEPYRTLDEVLALVDAIDTETVAAICKTYYAPGRQTLVSLGPEAAS